MKFKQSLSRVLAFAALVSSPALASTSKQLESLGGNQAISERADRIESRSRIGLVQARAVPRDWRLEFGTSFGPVAAGDAYLNTGNLSGQVDLHINPTFSVGARYSKMFNSLSQEARTRLERAREAYRVGASTPTTVPGIDEPQDSILGVVNWYMTYGKINLFDIRTVQFDIYSLAGYGQINLASGPAPTWTAGGGIGFWLAKHLSSRFEVRYQNYQDNPALEGSRDLHLIIGTFGLGVLL